MPLKQMTARDSHQTNPHDVYSLTISLRSDARLRLVTGNLAKNMIILSNDGV